MKIAVRDIFKKEIDKKIIYFLFPILIIVSKVIRYTLMKDNLVDEGIGHGFIEIINNNLYSNRTFGETLTIKFFDLINIFNLSTYVQFEIYISIIWNLILFFIIFRLNKKLNIIQTLFIILSIAVLNIFDFCLAKEPVQMLYFIALYLIIINKRISTILKSIFIILIFLLIAITLRKYYILMAFLFFVIFGTYLLLKKFNIEEYRFTIITLCIIISIMFLLILSSLFMPNQYEELVRVRTTISSAVSDIHVISENQINPSMMAIFVDYILVFIRLMIPIELLPLGIKYLPYVVYQLLITYILIKSLKKVNRNNENKNLAIFAYIAFVIGSAMFEPDFGSWIRHEAVFCPILFIICGAKNIESKISEKTKKKEE